MDIPADILSKPYPEDFSLRPELDKYFSQFKVIEG
jgi:hypothetical protein